MVFAIVFQYRSVSVAYLKDSDINITAEGVSAVITHRKGKSRSQLLRLSFSTKSVWTPTDSLNALLLKWSSLRPANLGFFNL